MKIKVIVFTLSSSFYGIKGDESVEGYDLGSVVFLQHTRNILFFRSI